MSEKIPSREAFPALSKQEVIDALLKDPEDLSVLHSYLDRREQEVTASKEILALNIEIAEIYKEAGFIEAARQAYADVADQAWQEEEYEMHQTLMSELNSLRLN